MKTILFCLLLLSCNSNDNVLTGSITELYKNGEYWKIVNEKDSVKSKLDSALFIISCLRINKIYPYKDSNLDRYWIINGGYNEEKTIGKDTTFLDSFPFEKYESMKLLLCANFYFWNKRAHLNVYHKFLKESIMKDSMNIYALYDLAKLAIYSNELSEAEFLLVRLLKLNDDYPKAKEMLIYVQKKLERIKSKYPTVLNKYSSIRQLVEQSIYVGSEDKKFFDF